MGRGPSAPPASAAEGRREGGSWASRAGPPLPRAKVRAVWSRSPTCSSCASRPSLAARATRSLVGGQGSFTKCLSNSRFCCLLMVTDRPPWLSEPGRRKKIREAHRLSQPAPTDQHPFLGPQGPWPEGRGTVHGPDTWTSSRGQTWLRPSSPALPSPASACPALKQLRAFSGSWALGRGQARRAPLPRAPDPLPGPALPSSARAPPALSPTEDPHFPPSPPSPAQLQGRAVLGKLRCPERRPRPTPGPAPALLPVRTGAAAPQAQPQLTPQTSNSCILGSIRSPR